MHKARDRTGKSAFLCVPNCIFFPVSDMSFIVETHIVKKTTESCDQKGFCIHSHLTYCCFSSLNTLFFYFPETISKSIFTVGHRKLYSKSHFYIASLENLPHDSLLL